MDKTGVYNLLLNNKLSIKEFVIDIQDISRPYPYTKHLLSSASPFYSYLRDSIGSDFAAFRAGSNPNSNPIKVQIRTAFKTVVQSI